MKTRFLYFFVSLLTSLLVVSCGVVTKTYKQPQTMFSGNLYRDTIATDTNNLATVSWKQLFSDPILQHLIQNGLDQNLDLKTAMEKVKEAQATLRENQLAYLPSLSAGASGTRNKLSRQATLSSSLYSTVWTGALSASWELDIWGKLNSSRKAALAAFLASDAAKRAAQTELVANIATYYYTLLSLDEKLAITRSTVKNRENDVTTMKLLKESAVVNGAAVVQSQANLYSAEVSIPDLLQSIHKAENALCILLGRTPGTIERGKLSEQNPQVDLKIGIPSQLLKNRPDVQEAALAFRQAFENTNVSRTAFYPSLTLTAEGGLSSFKLKDFFDHSIFYSLVGGLTQPIFSKGENRANYNIAKAKQQQAFYGFQKTILTAGTEVSDALYAYQMELTKEDARTKQLQALEKSVDFTKELLKYSSATNYTDVLTSEESLLTAQLSAISDRLQKLQAIIDLYKALGGGWR
jgi:outer membrane protein, multidrug efflux system